MHLGNSPPLVVDEVFSELCATWFFRSIADQTFKIGEGNVRRSGAIALIVRNDLVTIAPPNSYTRVSRAEVDTNRIFSP